MKLSCQVHFILIFQGEWERKKRTQRLKYQSTIFLNSTKKHKRLYFSYRFIELTCLMLHMVASYCLFYLLDQRFVKIGYSFITEPEVVNDVFGEHAFCLAAKNSGVTDKGLVAERRTCHLLQNDFNKIAILGLWFLFAAVLIGHLLNFGLQALILLTCMEKR